MLSLPSTTRTRLRACNGENSLDLKLLNGKSVCCQCIPGLNVVDSSNALDEALKGKEERDYLRRPVDLEGKGALRREETDYSGNRMYA